VQPDANVDYCSSLECGTVLNRLLGAQPFNYTDATDALPNAVHAFGGPLGVAAGGPSGQDAFINASGLFADPGAVDVEAETFWNMPAYQSSQYGASTSGWNPKTGQGQVPQNMAPGASPAGASSNHSGGYTTGGGGGPGNYGGFADGAGHGPEKFAGQAEDHNVVNSGISDAGTFVLAETALDMHCWGENPVVTAKLQLNGQDRFSEREGTYFDLVQPYQHHTRNPDTGINVYSFALRPEEHQPSGTCNFSRIDNATLQLVLSNATVEGTSTAKVRVYATNYNVLRVMSGMGGLAYSN